MILIRILEKVLIIYFGIYVVIDILLYLYSIIIFKFRSGKKKNTLINNIDQPSVSIVVPAYNEEVSIVVCVKMLLQLDYENYQVVVVNDGSKDSTLEKITEHFQMMEMNNWRNNQNQINTSLINNVYLSENKKLIVIDKQNGGKADAINAGLNFSQGEFICTIDADSILDSDALKHVIQPMLENESVFVSGGQIALSNDLKLVNNKVVSAKMPKNIFVLWQILEYISTFMIARISLSKINALLIMSGAFSIFRKKDLCEVGGFLTKQNDHQYILKSLGKGKQTITEDMEIVLRLWKFYRDRKRKAKAVFLPGPVCWTEAPEKLNQLYKQRMRWHQGLAETLWLYRNLMFEPKYKSTGMIAIPYYFFMELAAPVIKLLAFILIIVLILTGNINQYWVIYFITGTIILYTIILSSMTVIIEKWSMSQTISNRDALRYKSLFDWLILLLSGVIANFTYALFRMYAQLHGIMNFFRKRHNWMKFDRKGIQV